MTETRTPLAAHGKADHEWLTQVLTASGDLAHGGVTKVTRRVWRQSRHADLIRVEATYGADARNADGAPPPAKLMLKISRAGAAAKPNPHYARKEFEFYSRIAGAMHNPPCARCFDCAFDPTSGRFHFLLEDLSATYSHVRDPLPPSVPACEKIMESLARLHAAWWNDPRVGTAFGNPYHEERWTSRAKTLEKRTVKLLDFLGDRLPGAHRRIYRNLCEVFPRLIARQGAGHLTVTHGDAHYQNFLIARDSADCRIIDWEDWELAPATDDLAFLMAVLWFAPRRKRLEQPLLHIYHQALIAAGVKNYPWSALWADYRLSVVKYLCKPVFQWANGVSASLWWDNLERVLAAYDDLGCAEIMNDLLRDATQLRPQPQ
jgi:aminoglycoside phosphotransferase (APT) family kinase protein